MLDGRNNWMSISGDEAREKVVPFIILKWEKKIINHNKLRNRFGI